MLKIKLFELWHSLYLLFCLIKLHRNPNRMPILYKTYKIQNEITIYVGETKKKLSCFNAKHFSFEKNINDQSCWDLLSCTLFCCCFYITFCCCKCSVFGNNCIFTKLCCLFGLHCDSVCISNSLHKSCCIFL